MNEETENNIRTQSTGLEIMSRLIKLLNVIGGLLLWLLYFLGAYSVYLLWNVDQSSQYFRSHVEKQLVLGWITIGAIVFIRLSQLAMNWVILVPIEARILGIDLRDSKVSAETREGLLQNLRLEGIILVFLIAVPLLVAYFRFDYFG